MPGINQAKPPPSLGLLSGIGLLLRGQDRGFAYFGRSPLAFVFSLAPLMSLLPVEASLSVTTDGPHRAMTELLAGFCMLLLPPVISQAIAQHWHRDILWPRYAIAFNWCRWALFLLMVAGLMVAAHFSGGNLDSNVVLLTMGGFVVYDLWLQWFLARRGLQLGRDVAALTVALVNILALILAVGAYMLGKI